MATKLVFKKANFSADAIERPLYSEGDSSINLLNNAGCGYRNTTATAVKNGKRMSAYADNSYKPILIKAGETVKLKGLKGKNGQATALKVDYAYYSADDVIEASTTGTNPNLVGTASNFSSSKTFPLNAEGNDSVVFKNGYGQDYYFAFAMCGVQDVALTPSDYSLSLEWQA